MSFYEMLFLNPMIHLCSFKLLCDTEGFVTYFFFIELKEWIMTYAWSFIMDMYTRNLIKKYYSKYIHTVWVENYTNTKNGISLSEFLYARFVFSSVLVFASHWVLWNFIACDTVIFSLLCSLKVREMQLPSRLHHEEYRWAQSHTNVSIIHL